MTMEKVLDPLYPVSELVKRYSRTHDAAQSDLNLFVVDGKGVNIKGVLSALQEDFGVENYSRSLNDPADKGESAVERIIPRFLAHFQGQTLQEVCTLFNEYGKFLEEAWFFKEEWQREMIRQSAEREIAIATKALQNTSLDSGGLNAWRLIKSGAEEFLPKITATKSAPSADMIRK